MNKHQNKKLFKKLSRIHGYPKPSKIIRDKKKRDRKLKTKDFIKILDFDI